MQVISWLRTLLKTKQEITDKQDSPKASDTNNRDAQCSTIQCILTPEIASLEVPQFNSLTIHAVVVTTGFVA